jgi:hypothetical protein
MSGADDPFVTRANGAGRPGQPRLLRMEVSELFCRVGSIPHEWLRDWLVVAISLNQERTIPFVTRATAQVTPVSRDSRGWDTNFERAQ